jgi:hypothetical protein
MMINTTQATAEARLNKDALNRAIASWTVGWMVSVAIDRCLLLVFSALLPV